jgi:hypothetical protein
MTYTEVGSKPLARLSHRRCHDVAPSLSAHFMMKNRIPEEFSQWQSLMFAP